MSVITTATNVLVFINELRPELTKLFDQHRGDVPAAKRDLQSLLPAIEKEEARIDEALAEQDAAAKSRDLDMMPAKRPGRRKGGSDGADR